MGRYVNQRFFCIFASMIRKVLIATTTRADWGILSPLARELRRNPDVEVEIMASNMHLDPSRGDTLAEIRADGFNPVVAPMNTVFESAADAARAMGQCGMEASSVMQRLEPDVIVVLGDRFEALAIAASAAVMRIPVIHISGGEVTEGAFDDCFRHAISKLAALHLATTDGCRDRLLQMGEEEERIVVTGSLAAANAAAGPEMSREELEADLGWQFGDRAMLFTLHPETMSAIGADRLATETLAALDRFPEHRILMTYPNNDPEGEKIIKAINAYAARWPERVKIVPSLGRRRYMVALRCVALLVGNSSSGLCEVPSAGIPTVDIGDRQKGRDRGMSVFHAEVRADSITAAIQKALEFDRGNIDNPYYRPGALQSMAQAVATYPMEILRRPKRFIDRNS